MRRQWRLSEVEDALGNPISSSFLPNFHSPYTQHCMQRTASHSLFLGNIIIFCITLAAQALNISIPADPVINGATFPVGWTAGASDPLAFTLQLLCEGKVTLEDPVDRVTSSNDSGTVSYLSGCLGEHFVQAVAVKCVQ
ncbi:hypothetical protein R3P38DRAFT_2906488 [Favolaschia claudopus]|uniref:Uncharacterized protein n=1 Tax=Favolaschia claudopus TaxID=2862362 RepID=A0AAW0CGE6_9AGAR